jgi:UDP-MurNAc hydroxylase
VATELVWINHAGYELRIGGLRIVHDPWLAGLAFGDGWALVSPTRFGGDDFVGVDYIWFSHEHPDHFSPASLKQIPERARPSITVLFQETKDRRVIEFCKKMGFKTQELPDRQPVALNAAVTVTCGKVIGRDSWLHVAGPDVSIFNANDCVPGGWHDIARLFAPPDLLLVQFSYANWTGNPGDDHKMKLAADAKLREMQAQISAFKPKTLIPFASFVWFCRDDNFHLNKHVNKIDRVEQRFKNEVDVVVLYPGERYTVGDAHDNGPAVNQYLNDWAAIVKPMDHVEKVIPLTELLELSSKEQKRLKNHNMMGLLKPLKWAGFVQPTTVFLRDLNQGISYSMFGGVLQSGLQRSQCEIECTSNSFAAMLRNGFGYGTLAVNGRYVELRDGGAVRLSRHFAIAARNEEGEFVPGVFLKGEYVAFQIKRLLGMRA